MSLIENFKSILGNMAKEAAIGKGLVYETYAADFTQRCNAYAATLPPDQRDEFIRLATEKYDYMTAEELRVQNQLFEDEGLCVHGLDEMTCPCGCFEGDVDEDFYKVDEMDLTLTPLDVAAEYSKLQLREFIYGEFEFDEDKLIYLYDNCKSLGRKNYKNNPSDYEMPPYFVGKPLLEKGYRSGFAYGS
jgi:hypothetical protein